MLAFTMLWAYMSFSQYLIIWSGNLTEEIPWYLHRSLGAWRYVALALIVFHFFLPFFLLLNREAKRQYESLVEGRGADPRMHVVNDSWLVLPAPAVDERPPLLGGRSRRSSASAGSGRRLFTWQLKSKPLVPRHDPMLAEALVHHGAPPRMSPPR